MFLIILFVFSSVLSSKHRLCFITSEVLRQQHLQEEEDWYVMMQDRQCLKSVCLLKTFISIMCVCVCVSAPQSQLSDLPPTMLKNNFAAVPLAQTCVFLYPCFTIKKQTNTELREHTKPRASIPYFKPNHRSL